MQEKFAVKFVEKMQDFFQELRDMCRDFIVTLPKLAAQQSNEANQRTKLVISKAPDQQISKIKQEARINDNDDQQLPPPPSAKPKSPFLFYVEKRRPIIAEKNPGIRIEEIVRIINKEWQEMPREEQEVYIRMAEKERRRIEQQRRPYDDESDSFGDFLHKSMKI